MSGYFFVRLLREDNPRWWLAIGAVLGIGMMTKYTMIFFIAGLVAGVIFTPARRYLKSPWLWIGVAISIVIFLPNLIWQLEHNFISLAFLNHIHARDVRIGRTDGFLVGQLTDCTNLFTLPLWLARTLFLSDLPERASLSRDRMDVHCPAAFVLCRPRAGPTTWRRLTRCFSPRDRLSGKIGSRRLSATPALVGRAVTWIALGAGATLAQPSALPLRRSLRLGAGQFTTCGA